MEAMNSTDPDEVTQDIITVMITSLKPACSSPSIYDTIIKFASPVIMIVGTIFNLLSFIVFQRPNLRGVITTLFYRFLVLSDTAILQITVWSIIARYHFDITCCHSGYVCRLIQYLINTFMDFNAWVLCILHFNAHGLVAYPHKANVQWTMGRALKAGFVALMLALMLNLPVLLLTKIHLIWAAAKLVWATTLAFFAPVVFNILINVTLHRTTHPESIGCCKLTSMAVIVMSIYVINTCLNLPFNLNQLFVAMKEGDEVILLPGYVTTTSWRVVVPYFCLLVGSAIKFAVFRSICPRFSGECNKQFGFKETSMRPFGAQKKDGSRRAHIHMDNDKFSKNAKSQKQKTEDPSTQQESVTNGDQKGVNTISKNTA